MNQRSYSPPHKARACNGPRALTAPSVVRSDALIVLTVRGEGLAWYNEELWWRGERSGVSEVA